MRQAKRIEIAGGIASGKTTLVNLLRRLGLVPIHERFRQNPFYAAFYKDPAGTAFEAEIAFLLQHYHQQRQALLERRAFCSDFSLVLDRAYASVTLSRRDQRVFATVYRRASKNLPPRSLLIHLKCAPEIELGRIRRRRRAVERTIALPYLEKIDYALSKHIEAIKRTETVLTLDSGAIDFARKPKSKAEVVFRVNKALVQRRIDNP
jgi:deoxyguanosine kinase